MRRNIAWGVLVAAGLVSAGLAGCATKPVDDTPVNKTAVFEKHVINNGLKGFFPFDTDETNYVRADMRRDESTLKGTGTFSSFIVGTHSGTRITRLDRKLLWSLDTKKEEYTECPLLGCAPKHGPAKPAADAPKQPEAQHESGCVMRIADVNFTVTPTGQKKPINGFDTDEYKVAWVIKLRDNQARTATSTLGMDIWTTPLTQDMRDAMNMERTYARAFAASALDAGKNELVPDEAAKLIVGYLGGALRAEDRRAFLDASKKLQKMKGYPIWSELTWNLEGNACASKEQAKPAEQKSSHDMKIPGSAGELASGLAGMFVEKKAADMADEASKEPILKFTVEVKAIRMDSVHDSLFVVPANYHLVQKQ